MPCDKDFGFVRVSQGLTCGCYDLQHIPETNVLNRVQNYVLLKII